MHTVPSGTANAPAVSDWRASFSFQNGKVMTAGEGGIVTTSDADFAERCRSFANQGRQSGARLLSTTSRQAQTYG